MTWYFVTGILCLGVGLVAGLIFGLNADRAEAEFGAGVLEREYKRRLNRIAALETPKMAYTARKMVRIARGERV